MVTVAFHKVVNNGFDVRLATENCHQFKSLNDLVEQIDERGLPKARGDATHYRRPPGTKRMNSCGRPPQGCQIYRVTCVTAYSLA